MGLDATFGNEPATASKGWRCKGEKDDVYIIEALARSILANSWFSNQANKRLLEKTDGMSIGDGLRYEIEHNKGRGPDMKERISAFGKWRPKLSNSSKLKHIFNYLGTPPWSPIFRSSALGQVDKLRGDAFLRPLERLVRCPYLPSSSRSRLSPACERTIHLHVRACT